jgi:hypothetical protein
VTQAYVSDEPVLGAGVLLEYPIEKEIASASAPESSGCAILRVDDRGVGRFGRIDDGAALAPGEVRLRFHRAPGSGVVRACGYAWFFDEAKRPSSNDIKYAEIRVDGDGRALLAGVRDASLAVIGR